MPQLSDEEFGDACLRARKEFQSLAPGDGNSQIQMLAYLVAQMLLSQDDIDIDDRLKEFGDMVRHFMVPGEVAPNTIKKNH